MWALGLENTDWRRLLERGARDIAFVGGPLTTRQNADRRAGALKALEAAGHGTLREMIVGEMTPRAGHKAAEQLLAELPDAIFCANDLLAMGALRVLLQQGIRVPDPVMLIGYDDVEYTLASAVPLTSICQPTYQLGRIAAELLLDECDHPETHAHQQIMFQPELVIRESTSP